MDVDIRHDKENRRFYTIVDDHEAYLQYQKKGPTILDLYELFVPVVMRQEDLGTKLTEAALRYAQLENYQILPNCDFVEHYLDEHSEYNKMVVKDMDDLM